MSTVLREIVLEQVASSKHDDYCATLKKFEAQYQALEWLLAQNPTPPFSVGSGFERRNWRLLRSQPDPLAKTPEIWIVYYYNDHQIIIVDIHVNG